MSLGYLARVVRMAAFIVLAFVCVGLYAELRSNAAVPKQERGSALDEGRDDTGPRIVLEAQLLPQGDTILLLPDVPDVLVRRGDAVTSLRASYSPEDGRLCLDGRTGEERVWLFAVVSKTKPTVAIR